MTDYQIVTDATADYSKRLLATLPYVMVIPMRLEIGGQPYTYGPDGTISAKDFYTLQRKGGYATTSQIGPAAYRRFFEPVLREGKDILYLCFFSGMSGTYQSALLCAEELQQQYPDRKIRCVDTLSASVGEGLLVCEAARRQAEGYSLERLADWIVRCRLYTCHWFTVDTFDHLKKGGRVSSAAAVLGTALQIKPLLHIENDGRLAVADKPRGRRNAIAAQLARMEASWQPGMASTVFVGHGDCPDAAQQLCREIGARFPDAQVEITEIDPIIGAHTGPGMLAVGFFGEKR